MSRWFAIVNPPKPEPKPGLIDRAAANTRKQRKAAKRARAQQAADATRPKPGRPRVLKGGLG
jgi:hypothetical protein